VEKKSILPRPLAPTEGLVRRWLGEDGVRRWLFEGNVRDRITLAIEDAILEQYPDGNLPPVERLLDPAFVSPREVARLQASKREISKQVRAALEHRRRRPTDTGI